MISEWFEKGFEEMYRKKKARQIHTSSIKLKFENPFFVDLYILYNLLVWNCSATSVNQNRNNFVFATCSKQVNQQKVGRQVLAEWEKLYGSGNQNVGNIKIGSTYRLISMRSL